jgi:hypothetical protein
MSSEYDDLIRNLEKCTNKFDELLTLKEANSPNLKQKEEEIEELFSGIEKNQPDEVADYIERMHRSEENEEAGIINDFKALEPSKKQVLLKMMEIIWKMGLVENESDVAKRERWYDILKTNF